MTTPSPRLGRPRDAGLAQRRQQEILAAAMPFFAEKGYRQADVQVLADRLGVGKGTIYRYFPSKRVLFFATVDAGMQSLLAAVDAAVLDEPDPVIYLKRGIRTYLRYFEQHPALVELLLIERGEFRHREKATYSLYKERTQSRWSDLLKVAMKAGVFRTMPPERIIYVIGDCLYGTIFTNHFFARTLSYEQQAEDIIDLVLHGVLRHPSYSKP